MSVDIKLELKCVDESVAAGTPARIHVVVNGEVVSTIFAQVKPQQGADGKEYPAVEFSGTKGGAIPGNVQQQ